MTADTASLASGARTAFTTLAETRMRRCGVAFVLFTVLTVIWMWPLVTHLNTRILSGPTDGALAIRQYWVDAHQGKTPFTTTHDGLIGAPEGVPSPGATSIAEPIQSSAVWLLKDVVGFITAFNIFLLAGFVLTGFAAYVFLDFLELHPIASFFGAYVIAFNPWSFARALAGHAAFVHIWVLIVLAGALLALDRRPTMRSAVVAGLAYGLAFQMASYWGLLATLLVAVFYVVQLIRERSWAGRFWLCTLACGTGAALFVTLIPAVIAYHNERAVVQQSIGHPIGQLSEFAATIPNYVVPTRLHPALGWLGRQVFGKTVSTERSVFFGWTTLALAAIVIALRIRRPQVFDRPRLRFAVLLFAVIAPAAFITSLEPLVDVGGVKIPTPAWFLGHITTYYRVYARFGIVFGLAVAVLAAVAIDLLLRRRHGLGWTAVLFAVTVFQLLPGSITTWAADRQPAWDAWLAKAPNGIVAHYPLLSDDVPSQTMGFNEQYFQRFNARPLYNMTLLGSLVSREGAIRLLSRDIADPTTPGILSAEHVRYVVVHDDVYRQEGSRAPVLGAAFKPVARFGPVRIYTLRKTAPADLNALIEQNASLIAQLQNFVTGTVDLGSGFYAGEKYSYAAGASAVGLWHWMQQDGELIVHVPSRPGVKYAVSGQGFSSSTPRSVDLITKSGTILAHAELPSSLANLSLGPITLSPGAHRLYLYTNPAPATLGGGDTRVASIFLSPLVLQPLPNLTDLNAGS